MNVPPKKPKQSRKEYHRMRYQSLSTEQKQRRIKQIKDSLQRKLDNYNVTQLAEYKEKKKCRNQEHYLNQKVTRALGDLCVSKAVKRRANVFGQVQARIIIPPHVRKLYHLVGNSPIPGGSFGCYVSQSVNCITAVTCVCLSVYAVALKRLLVGYVCTIHTNRVKSQQDLSTVSATSFCSWD